MKSSVRIGREILSLSGLYHLAVFKDNDIVATLSGGQVVCDDKYGSLLN